MASYSERRQERRQRAVFGAVAPSAPEAELVFVEPPVKPKPTKPRPTTSKKPCVPTELTEDDISFIRTATPKGNRARVQDIAKRRCMNPNAKSEELIPSFRAYLESLPVTSSSPSSKPSSPSSKPSSPAKPNSKRVTKKKPCTPSGLTENDIEFLRHASLVGARKKVQEIAKRQCLNQTETSASLVTKMKSFKEFLEAMPVTQYEPPKKPTPISPIPSKKPSLPSSSSSSSPSSPSSPSSSSSEVNCVDHYENGTPLPPGKWCGDCTYDNKTKKTDCHWKDDGELASNDLYTLTLPDIPKPIFGKHGALRWLNKNKFESKGVIKVVENSNKSKSFSGVLETMAHAEEDRVNKDIERKAAAKKAKEDAAAAKKAALEAARIADEAKRYAEEQERAAAKAKKKSDKEKARRNAEKARKLEAAAAKKSEEEALKAAEAERERLAEEAKKKPVKPAPSKKPAKKPSKPTGETSFISTPSTSKPSGSSSSSAAISSELVDYFSDCIKKSLSK